MSRKKQIVVRSYKSQRKMEKDLNRMLRDGYVVKQQSGYVDSFTRRMVMPMILRRHRATVTYELKTSNESSNERV